MTVLNNFLLTDKGVACGHCGYIQHFDSEAGSIGREWHSIKCCVRLGLTTESKLRDALMPFAAMYQDWRSAQGNPMMIAKTDDLRKAYEAIIGEESK